MSTAAENIVKQQFAAFPLEPLPLVDLGPLLRNPPPPPERFCNGLLYRGCLHTVAGAPESGKTTLTVAWMKQLLTAGETVLLLDEESGRDQVVDKLLSFGFDPDTDRLPAYAEFPGLSWDERDALRLTQLLEQLQPALVVLDSASAALSAAGLNESSNEDVGPVYRLLLKLARASGAAFVVIDHLTKNDEGGRYSRGAGVKLGLVDVSHHVERIRPFTRHSSGLLVLEVKKDRLGYIGSQSRNEICVDVSGGHITVTVQPADAELKPGALSPAGQKLLEALSAAAGIPETQSELVDRIAAAHGHGLRRETVSRLLKTLVEKGLADELHGNPKRWIHVPQDVTK